MALTGTWPRSLDDKGRLVVPKRVRESLGQNVGELFVAQGTEKSLTLYTPESFERLAQRYSEKSGARADIRGFMRLFYARAERLDVDSQGRIRIPDRLKSFAGLDREVVLLGVNDHLELWDTAHWEDYVASLNPQFDDIATLAYE
jgi:MraZ protein